MTGARNAVAPGALPGWLAAVLPADTAEHVDAGSAGSCRRSPT